MAGFGNARIAARGGHRAMKHITLYLTDENHEWLTSQKKALRISRSHQVNRLLDATRRRDHAKS